MNFVAIDFETANYSAESACSVGLVKVVDGEIVDSVAHLIRPPTRDFVFTYIHGLRWRDVEFARSFGELWPEIADFIQGARFLAAHNASFDQGVLRACLSRYAIDHKPLAFQCTVNMARATWKLYPTKLPDVCRHLDIELNHHEALSDAMACARIVIAATREVKEKPVRKARSTAGAKPG